MASAGDWADLGRENLDVAEQLLDERRWRSCVSRAYYSAMATSHALLVALGQQPPERGNWSNERLPTMLFDVLCSLNRQNRAWLSVAKSVRMELSNAWAYRLHADYRPTAIIGERVANEAVKCARRLIRYQERLA